MEEESNLKLIQSKFLLGYSNFKKNSCGFPLFKNAKTNSNFLRFLKATHGEKKLIQKRMNIINLYKSEYIDFL